MNKLTKVLGFATLGAMGLANAAVDLTGFDEVKADVTSVGNVLIGVAIVAVGAGLVYKFIWGKK